MNFRHPNMLRPSLPLRAVFAGLLAFFVPACSGGEAGVGTNSPSCDSQSKFCLVSCNLGCTIAGTCAISEIAQNQPIELQFSDLIDPASVTSGAVSLRTASGEAPSGSFTVSGSTLVFVPEVRITGGVTRFGFRAGEDYILNIRQSDSGESLRSVSGDRLARSVVCTLSVSQGLIDLDGRRPVAELITPSVLTGVPKDSQIVVRFSELIDLSSFSGGSTLTSPIIYQIRETVPNPVDPNGERICNDRIGYTPTLIDGVPIANVVGSNPPRTEIVLQPAIDLPAGVCVDVIITELVRDLAGKPAEEQRFRFRVDAGNPVPTPISETFENDGFLDRDVSGGTWASGRAIPARIGGSGVLGSFDYSTGLNSPPLSANYVFSTDAQTFGADRTLFGDQIVVTDGVFEFTDFIVPSGVRVVFQGSRPAIIKVRGAVRIDGELSVNGSAPSASYDARGTQNGIGQPGNPNPGEVGAAGGAGAGDGGHGGQSCLGFGTTAAMFGSPGEDCVALGSSGYAGQLSGTGGRGGLIFPATGLRTSVSFNLFFSISGMVNGGGGGGSFLGAGQQGQIIRTFTSVPTDIGPGAAGGQTVGFIGLPPGVLSLDHFLVGGSGGGGGGTHPVNMTQTEVNGGGAFGPKPWHAGGGGGGGGGALALRVGRSFDIAAPGVLSAKGGGGAQHLTSLTGPPSPGGGGSGGSVVIQIEDANRFVNQGSVDVSGGAGTFISNRQFNNATVDGGGGQGGHGYVRLEGENSSVSRLGTVVGPASVGAQNIGVLAANDGDLRTAFQSKWRSTRQIFPPRMLSYQVTALVNGQQVVYTDDPAAFNPADRNDLPIRIYFQGGRVNPATNALEGDEGPWRNYVAESAPIGQTIAEDRATGFRFMIVFNRDIETDVVIEDVTVIIEA